MSIDLSRLRTGPAVGVGLVTVLLATSAGAVRHLVWADLRDGMVRTDGLGRSGRALVRVGLLLVGVMIAALLGSEVLRGRFDLLVATQGVPGRGTHVPTLLVPLTMFMIAVAWTFLLTGALHAHRLMRVVVVVAYVGTTAQWLVPLHGGPAWGPAGGALLAVPVLVALTALPPLRRRRPGIEFTVLLAVVGGLYALVQHELVSTYRSTGATFFLSAVQGTVTGLSVLVLPLLVIVGLDVADFAYRASTWALQVVGSRSGRVLLPLATGGVLGWQVVTCVGAALAAVGEDGVGPLLGAAVVPVLTGLCALGLSAVARRSSRHDTAGGEEPAAWAGLAAADHLMGRATALGLRLAIAVSGWQILLLLAVLGVAGVLAVVGVADADLLSRALAGVGVLLGGLPVWLAALEVALVVLAVVLVRRGRRLVGLYLAVVGAVGLWRSATTTGAVGPVPWDATAFGWPSEELVTLWWLVAFVAVAAVRAARGALDRTGLLVLLFVAVSTLLAGGAEAVADPFSPFFAGAGIGLVAFALVWDAVTAGHWTNAGSRAFPSLSRILLYIGYVLLSVTIITWVVTTHDLSALSFFTSGAAAVGLDTLARPLLYTIYSVLLVDLARSGGGSRPPVGGGSPSGDLVQQDRPMDSPEPAAGT
ncbi:MAG: hypothetical protein JWP95_1458 [Actinotalea sp.]|nr:hypothetical protein [Actinotalea sp.]